MGRRIEHNRKISSDRVRKVRKQKSKVLIAVEGKNKTEKIYFSNFKDGKKHIILHLLEEIILIH